METESGNTQQLVSLRMPHFIRPLVLSIETEFEPYRYYSVRGTCFLLSVDGNPFIVTAKHCVCNNHGQLAGDRLFVFENLSTDHFVPIPYHGGGAVDVFGTDYQEIAFFPVDSSQYRQDAVFFPYHALTPQDFDIRLNCIFVAGFRNDMQNMDCEGQLFTTEMDVLNILSLRQDTETEGSKWIMNVDFDEESLDTDDTNKFDGLSGSPVIAYNPTAQTCKILGVVVQGHHTPRILRFVSFLSPMLEIVLNAIPHSD